jgi:hypothetical protein
LIFSSLAKIAQNLIGVLARVGGDEYTCGKFSQENYSLLEKLVLQICVEKNQFRSIFFANNENFVFA